MKIEQIINNSFVRTIASALFIILLLVLITLIWLNSYTHHNQAVVVPELKGLTMEDASKILRNNNLNFNVVDSVFNQSVPKGTIAESIPQSGSKVKEGRTVYIIINSLSEKSILMPDVIDQSQRQATATLTALGFTNINIVQVPAAFKDLVVGIKYKGHSVKPGERIPASSVITLEISSGDGSLNELENGNEEVLNEEEEPLF